MEEHEETAHSPETTSEQRKVDHIELATKSQLLAQFKDSRFEYEPLLGKHPDTRNITYHFMGFELGAPFWISSMTGGSEKSEAINSNLALACNELKIGMGLGSCRPLLGQKKFLKDFSLRKKIGDKLPLFANLGIAQIEQLLLNNRFELIDDLINSLEADGLIVHINPLQEFLQPEGDYLYSTPLETIKKLTEKARFSIIVKEVGQGMGPRSLEALMSLPISAVEFGAFGGTNFSKLETLRSGEKSSYSFVGHTAQEMVLYVNTIKSKLGAKCLCDNVIISGGIHSALDGYYLRENCVVNSVYGIASRILPHAAHSPERTIEFLKSELNNYELAKQVLVPRKLS